VHPIAAGIACGVDSETHQFHTDAQVPDSAGTMSAIMTGEKTRIGVFGIAASVSQNDCAAGPDTIGDDNATR
jgi:alkaline phosphatase